MEYMFGGNHSVSAQKDLFEYNYGVELGFQIHPIFGLAGKISQIIPGEINGNSSYESSISGFNINLDGEFKVQSTLMPLLFGIWLGAGNEVGFNYRGFLFLGSMYAEGTMDMKFEMSASGLNIPYDIDVSIPYEGKSTVFEFGGSIGYDFTSNIGLYVDISYLFAVVESMYATKNIDVDDDGYIDIPKGVKYTDIYGNTLNFDYSGFHINLGIKLAM